MDEIVVVEDVEHRYWLTGSAQVIHGQIHRQHRDTVVEAKHAQWDRENEKAKVVNHAS